jgi:hypothetical protein
VLDAYGRVIRVYDGANGGYWLPDGKQASAHFNVNTYATVAWSELKDGETLVVFPNGVDGNKARQIGLDCRYLFNQKLNLTGVEFMSTTLTVSIGASKTYTAEFGMWAINEEITTTNAATKAVWVFTKAYTGSFNTNGYGVRHTCVSLDKNQILCRNDRNDRIRDGRAKHRGALLNLFGQNVFIRTARRHSLHQLQNANIA